MALLFFDGFEHYVTADLLKKWDNKSTADAFANISSTQKRTGSYALQMCSLSPDTTFTLTKYLPSAISTCVLGFAFDFDVYTKYVPSWRFYTGTTIQIDVRVNTDRTISIYRGTTLLGTSISAICNLAEWNYIEIKVVIHDSTGSVTVRKNGAVFYELTNVDTNNSGGTIDGIKLCISSNGTGTYVYYDDLYIDDADFLGDVKVETLYPSAAGTTTSWDSSAGDNYACVDEATPNSDTDYVSSSTPDEIDTYIFGNLTTTTGIIKGVQVSAYTRKDDAGNRNIALVARPGSVDRVGSTQAIGDTYSYLRQLWENNPDTLSAWSITEVNASEFGVKLVS